MEPRRALDAAPIQMRGTAVRVLLAGEDRAAHPGEPGNTDFSVYSLQSLILRSMRCHPLPAPAAPPAHTVSGAQSLITGIVGQRNLRDRPAAPMR